MLLVSEIFNTPFPTLSMIFKYAYIFIGIASLLFSFSLPKMILNLQEESIDSAVDESIEIQKKKNRDSI